MALRSTALFLALATSAISAPSSVGGTSNLYTGGTTLDEQPNTAPTFVIGGGQYRDRYSSEKEAIKGCQESEVCKGQKNNCRSIGYVLNQVRCDQLAKSDGGGQSETTMLCDESAACKDDATTKCMMTYECETESPIYNRNKNWNNARFRGRRIGQLESGDGSSPGDVVMSAGSTQLHTAGEILAEHHSFPHDEAVQ